MQRMHFQRISLRNEGGRQDREMIASSSKTPQNKDEKGKMTLSSSKKGQNKDETNKTGKNS